MTLDLQMTNMQQQVGQLASGLADLKEQHALFEESQRATNAQVQERLNSLEAAVHSIIDTMDILSLALAEQYEQTLAVTEQGVIIMGAIAEVYEEIMISNDPAGGGEASG